MMNEDKCLCCYGPLKDGERLMHGACSRKMFGTREVPLLDYGVAELDELAAAIIREKTSLTGVQPKLSLHLLEHEGSKRFTIVGLWGRYICKPQTVHYAQLPEVEDVTMHLAEVAKIDVVPHCLMRMADGTLCYLTRRIDRTDTDEKIAMEDMCQLTERLTEHKYRSSYERVGKAIASFSSVPRMDVVNFMEVVIFAWLTGNNDMHLKNFSLYAPADGSVRLTPAYDLINAAIVNPADDEELALTLNGRKKHLRRADFVAAARTMGVEENVVNRLIDKMCRLLPRFEAVVSRSFMSNELKERYIALMRERVGRLV